MDYENLNDNDKRVASADKNTAGCSDLFLIIAEKFGTVFTVRDYRGIATISRFFGKEYLVWYEKNDLI